MVSEEDAPFAYWSSALAAAIRSENYTVELTAAERHGIQVEIDGVPMFSGGSAYPEEQFTITTGKEYVHSLTENGLAKLEEVADD